MNYILAENVLSDNGELGRMHYTAHSQNHLKDLDQHPCYCQACRSSKLPAKLPEFQKHYFQRTSATSTLPEVGVKTTLIRASTAEGFRGRSQTTKRFYETRPMVLKPSRSNSLPLNYSWPSFTVNREILSKESADANETDYKALEPEVDDEKEISCSDLNQKEFIDGSYQQIVEDVNKGGDNIADHFEVRPSGVSSHTSPGSNITIRFDDLKEGFKHVQDCIEPCSGSLTVVLSKK